MSAIKVSLRLTFRVSGYTRATKGSSLRDLENTKPLSFYLDLININHIITSQSIVLCEGEIWAFQYDHAHSDTILDGYPRFGPEVFPKRVRHTFARLTQLPNVQRNPD